MAAFGFWKIYRVINIEDKNVERKILGIKIIEVIRMTMVIIMKIFMLMTRWKKKEKWIMNDELSYEMCSKHY